MPTMSKSNRNIRQSSSTSPNDENTRLLTPLPQICEPGKSNQQLSPRRPPLFTVPSSVSVRSLRSLNDPVADSYAEGIEYKTIDLDKYSYISYYIPILRWLPQYDFKSSFIGDLLAGISIASFQIPLVMSFATSLAHLPPVTGLCTMIIGPLMYAILGSVPVLIVGPAPSSALIYGQFIDAQSEYSSRDIASVISAVIGGILLGSGILRLGFLDTILSRSLLKGFLAAMGLIMIISELISELGLQAILSKGDSPTAPVTPLDRVLFVIHNIKSCHGLTTLISVISLSLVLLIRTVKRKMVSHGYRNALYFPELLLMVVIATWCSYYFEWGQKGVEIVGDLKGDTKESLVINPFQMGNFGLMKKTVSTAFLCTILGYFDSVIATKNIGSKYNYNVSSNRELVALGVTNVVVSFFGGIPAFGAFGRSKINIMAGATSPMSGLVMSIVTTFAMIYLLSYLFYLPECILALSTTIIGITVLEEIPEDLKFFWTLSGYDELFTFTIVFLFTLLWSAEAGVVLGVGIALIRIIKHSSRSGIHVLGRIPNSTVFRNVDALIEESFTNFNKEDDLNQLISIMEEIEGVLIIKIPEPLTFTNVGDLQARLHRIEKYGSLLVHPSQPQSRDIANIKFAIFDCKGMVRVDVGAIQVLCELVKRYTNSNIVVCFTRVPIEVRKTFSQSGLTRMVNDCFKHSTLQTTSVAMGDGFFTSIDDALKAAEVVV